MTEPTTDEQAHAPPAPARVTAAADRSVDPLAHPDTGETHRRTHRASKTAASRWVYVFWILGVLLVMAFVALHLTGVIGPGAH